MVIADEPLTNFVPLYKARAPTTSSPSSKARSSRKCGLLKMDFLGLRTLSVLERARELVKQNHGVDLDLEKIDIAEPEGLRALRRGETQGRLPV